MNFEYKYTQRIDKLLEVHSSRLDKMLSVLLENAGMKHELSESKTIKTIMTCCTQQSKTVSDVLIKTAIDIIRVDERLISKEKLWPIISKLLDTHCEVINEKKFTALKSAQGANFNRRLVEASSLKDAYAQHKN